MIDLLIPVLNRPQNAQPLVDSIRAATTVPYRVVFLATADDKDEVSACRRTGATILLCKERGYAHKINAGARMSKAEFLFLGADDLDFHADWDRAATDRYYATGKPVVGTNDLGNATVMAGKHATHSLVHRSYLEHGTVDDPEQLLNEGYEHNWVDTEFIETAKSRDAFTFAADSHVEHPHPFWKKGPDDDVYAWARARYHLDSSTYRQRRKLWR